MTVASQTRGLRTCAAPGCSVEFDPSVGVKGQYVFPRNWREMCSRSCANRKGNETKGPEARRAAAIKGNETMGPEARRAASVKGKETMGPEARRAAAIKGNETMGPEARRAAAIKSSKTVAADPIRYCKRSARLALAGYKRGGGNLV